jgi:hypothetical protein
MNILIFSLLLIATGFAVFSTSFRQIVFALLVVNVLVGFFGLQLGAEFFAIMIWLTGGTLTVALLVFGSTFGELFGDESNNPQDAEIDLNESRLPNKILPITTGLVCIALVALLWSSIHIALKSTAVSQEVIFTSDRHLFWLGDVLLKNPMIALLTLGLAVFSTAIGVGAITRPRQIYGQEPHQVDEELT